MNVAVKTKENGRCDLLELCNGMVVCVMLMSGEWMGFDGDIGGRGGGGRGRKRNRNLSVGVCISFEMVSAKTY